MKSIIKHTICSCLLSIVMAGPGLMAAFPGDNQPDQDQDGRSQRTPYQLFPQSPGSTIGFPNRDIGAIGPADSLSTKVYNFFRNIGPNSKNTDYFVPNASQSNVLHFDFVKFRTDFASNLIIPTLTPFHLKAGPIDTQAQVFFVDRNPLNTERHALGFIDTLQYAPSGNPLSNLATRSPNLLFPYVEEANQFTPGFQPSAAPADQFGRFMNITPTSVWDANNEHPLLLSDYSTINLPAGSEADLFLMTHVDVPDAPAANTMDNINLPGSGTNIWFSDPNKNYGNGIINDTNFPHFLFYEIPELRQGGDYAYYLTAIETSPLNSATQPLYDFDLYFLVRAFAPVPEPTTYLLIATLLFAAFIVGKKRKAELA